jgi:hypothetical protein
MKTLVALTYALNWPGVPVPEGAMGELVSNHMVFNGLTMRASRFSVSQPLDQVKAFYRKQWGANMTDTPLSGGSVLGHLVDDKYSITVQLSSIGNATTGRIGVMQLPAKDAHPGQSNGKGFARPAGTQVAEDILYLDTPKPVRTLMMVNRNSPVQNENFYTRELASQGYLKEPAARPCAVASKECSARYVRDQNRVTIASVREPNGTVITAIIE